MENATTASNKASLIIKIEGGVLKVVDKNGKGGGNVNIHQNKKMQFKNDTEKECTLTFIQIEDADDADEYNCSTSTWIFDEPKPADCTHVLAATGGDAIWNPKLKGNIGVIAVKYSVSVGGGVADLDPVIIVRQ
jgi:hypothetical protein